MKKILFVTFCLLYLAVVSFAQQNKIIRKEIQKYSAQEGELRPYVRALYQYDENNNEIGVQSFSWDKDLLAFVLFFSSTS